jgi:hypothetical protein
MLLIMVLEPLFAAAIVYGGIVRPVTQNSRIVILEIIHVKLQVKEI